LTSGTPYWSLRMSPILAELLPSLAIFTIYSSISVAVRGIHAGLSDTSGCFDPDFPFLLACILAMIYSSELSGGEA
jgi:hypothetical protein